MKIIKTIKESHFFKELGLLKEDGFTFMELMISLSLKGFMILLLAGIIEMINTININMKVSQDEMTIRNKILQLSNTFKGCGKDSIDTILIKKAPDYRKIKIKKISTQFNKKGERMFRINYEAKGLFMTLKRKPIVVKAPHNCRANN